MHEVCTVGEQNYKNFNKITNLVLINPFITRNETYCSYFPILLSLCILKFMRGLAASLESFCRHTHKLRRTCPADTEVPLSSAYSVVQGKRWVQTPKEQKAISMLVGKLSSLLPTGKWCEMLVTLPIHL